MSTALHVSVEVPSVRTWGGVLQAEGSLDVDVPPIDIAAGHRTIDQLAARAHVELRAAAAKIADQDPDAPSAA